MLEATLENPLKVRVGRWWFRNRSLSPVPLFIFMVVLPADFIPSQTLIAFCAILISCAEALRIWAVGFAGSVTRTRSEGVTALVHAGPFRYVRNPLYLANIFLYTSCGLLFGFWYLSLFTLFYSCIQYHFIVAFEEEILSRFGDRYREYCGSVPRWLPSLTPRISDSSHRFDLKKALRSERSTFYSMGAMAILYFLKGSMF